MDESGPCSVVHTEKNDKEYEQVVSCFRDVLSQLSSDKMSVHALMTFFSGHKGSAQCVREEK
jgi:hypothetical protein